MVFTFGKYAGLALADVPASYLGLALETFSISDTLACQCRAELIRRFSSVEQKSTASSTTAPLSVEKVKAVYRKLSIRHHPDKGGSTQAMQAVNDFYQELSR